MYILLTVPNHVITMTNSNRAAGNVPGSTKLSRAFRVSNFKNIALLLLLSL